MKVQKSKMPDNFWTGWGESMGRIKILHVIGGGEFGGAEQHLLSLLKHMDQSVFEIYVASLFTKPLAPLVEEQGIPVFVFPMRNKIDLRPIREMASLIQREGFHIVHTHGVRANLIGRMAARKAGVKNIVTTVHSVLAFDYESSFAKLVNRVCETSTRGMTQRFITVCELLARGLSAEGVNPQKIITVHNGLEIDKYNPELPSLPVRQEFSIKSDSVVLGIVARLHPVKGHSLLLEAVADVARDYPHLILLIVGTGPDLIKLENMAKGLGIEKNVIFTGFRQDIPQIIASLDILVLPSFSEGLSLTVMEGMAMKKPVLATRVGGTPELITSGLNGLLVPPADSKALAEGIRYLIGNPNKAVEMGVAGRQTIESSFTADIMAAKTAEVYTELIR